MTKPDAEKTYQDYALEGVYFKGTVRETIDRLMQDKETHTSSYWYYLGVAAERMCPNEGHHTSINSKFYSEYKIGFYKFGGFLAQRGGIIVFDKDDNVKEVFGIWMS